MANEPVEFDGPEGLTLTVNLFPFGSDTAASGSPFTCTERTNDKGSYTFTAVGLTGLHKLQIKLSTTTIGKASVMLANDTTTKIAGDFGEAPWNSAWDAEVQSEVQDALEANHLDHFIAVADPGSVVANNSFLAKLTSSSSTANFTTYDHTTDSLQASRDNVGLAGVGLTNQPDPAGVTTLLTRIGTPVVSVSADIATANTYLEDLSGLPGDLSVLSGYVSTVLIGAVQAIPAGVWQDTTSSHFNQAGSIGKSLFTAGVVPGAAGGLFIAGTNAATVVTTSFTTTFTGNVTGSVASVSGAVGSIATGGIDHAAITAAAAAKVADILLRRTAANIEASANGDTPSKDSLYGFMRQGQRSTITGSTMSIKKSDGTELGTRTLTSDASADPITGIS